MAARVPTAYLTNGQSGQHFLRSLGVDPSAIQVGCYLSSSLDGLASVEVASSDASLRVVVVGQVTERKGAMMLLRELERLSSNDPAARDRISVKWLGTGSLLNEAQARARSSNLPIEFLGHMDRSDLARELAVADLGLVTSLHDYRALAGFELLSLGCPILHSVQDGAASEVTLPGVNGLHFDPLVEGDLAAALATVLDDPSVLQRWRRASESHRMSFTPDAAGAVLASFLEENARWD